jgi:hypothetical protein
MRTVFNCDFAVGRGCFGQTFASQAARGDGQIAENYSQIPMRR